MHIAQSDTERRPASLFAEVWGWEFAAAWMSECARTRAADVRRRHGIREALQHRCWESGEKRHGLSPDRDGSPKWKWSRPIITPVCSGMSCTGF